MVDTRLRFAKPEAAVVGTTTVRYQTPTYAMTCPSTQITSALVGLLDGHLTIGAKFYTILS